MDLFDALVLVGLLLLGVALAIAWGWLAALAYVAVVMIVAGVVGALLRVRN